VSVPSVSASISLINTITGPPPVVSSSTISLVRPGVLIASPLLAIAVGKLGRPWPLKLFRTQSIAESVSVPLGILEAPPTVNEPPSND